MEAHLAKRKRNPARIPPQTPPAGGNQPRQGESKTPEKLFRPAESFFRILNQDCFGKKFGFCSGDTAKKQNSHFRQNSERRKATRRGFPPEFAKGF